MAPGRLGYDDIEAAKPKVACGSISGKGRPCTYGSWPSLDRIAQGMQGMRGMMRVTGHAGGEPARARKRFGFGASAGAPAAVVGGGGSVLP